VRADEAYAWLISASRPSACDRFDIHVVAAVLALAIEEAAERAVSIGEGSGLEREALLHIAHEMFPDAAAYLKLLAASAAPLRDTEEDSVRDIALMYATGSSWLEPPLAAMIARRCQRPNHLWQDLGLRDRGELSDLMRRHFAPLARKNHGDMKWKKFLYRMICSAEGFTLCTAPVCTECDDFDVCFGAEDGETRLARVRNGSEPAARTL
jgi:nitrogen fixation protein NifQ